MNGYVKRAQRTHTEEFYRAAPFSLEIAAPNGELLARERTTVFSLPVLDQ